MKSVSTANGEGYLIVREKLEVVMNGVNVEIGEITHPEGLDLLVKFINLSISDYVKKMENDKLKQDAEQSAEKNSSEPEVVDVVVEDDLKLVGGSEGC